MTEDERAQIGGRPLLLYDGVCVLCNGVVHFILRHDKHSIFRFAPLHSRLASELLAGSPVISDGVVLITETLTGGQQVHRRSDAVAAALSLLGGSWKHLGSLLTFIPRPVREIGYTIVARVRYRLFGRYATCPIPTADQRSRILGLSE